jgi:hypothetical protein
MRRKRPGNEYRMAHKEMPRIERSKGGESPIFEQLTRENLKAAGNAIQRARELITRCRDQMEQSERLREEFKLRHTKKPCR